MDSRQRTFRRIVVATFLALTIALPAGTVLAARGPGMQCTANPEADLRSDFIGAGSAVIMSQSTLCSYQVGIAAYTIPSGDPNDPGIDSQVWFSGHTVTIAPQAVITLTTGMPECAYQLDVFSGKVETGFAGRASSATRLIVGRRGGSGTCPANAAAAIVPSSETIATAGEGQTSTSDPGTIAPPDQALAQPTITPARIEVETAPEMAGVQEGPPGATILPVTGGEPFKVPVIAFVAVIAVGAGMGWRLRKTSDPARPRDNAR